jgi:hypothetical protein
MEEDDRFLVRHDMVKRPGLEAAYNDKRRGDRRVQRNNLAWSTGNSGRTRSGSLNTVRSTPGTRADEMHLKAREARRSGSLPWGSALALSGERRSSPILVKFPGERRRLFGAARLAVERWFPDPAAGWLASLSRASGLP